MPVFYRGPRAVITHSVVEVPRPALRRFNVAELVDVHIVRHDPGPAEVGQRVIGVSALVAATVAVPVIGPVSMVLTAVVLSGLSLYAAVCLRGQAGRRWWQVRAGYRGEVVEIFASRNQGEFEGFCRGLVRCLEYRGQ
ncbi:DUF6232 family protein [Actinoplanes oblitus]|uniref:DUF6232 family protein n=1 Tax=Actinoplanes oblitus TaxID=3040509 RepID=A0ABY8W8Y4_9ACTN|nr:DUF6232 family protein [Actinoplanes oblitus]WIM93812.1 DUF6232 family protein [Actinoplanes oblitus]